MLLLKKGLATPIILENTLKRRNSQIWTLSIDQIFTYYDELRGTGSDIPQDSETVNLITVDPQHIPIQRLLQGVLRLREFFLGQNVDFVVLKDSTSAIGHGHNGVYR